MPSRRAAAVGAEERPTVRGEGGRNWRRRLRKIGWNVLAGLGGGLFFATAFSLFVLIVRAFVGPEYLAPYHTTLGTVLEVYYGGFAAGGVVAGLLAPLRHFWWGRIILGFVVAFPVYLGAGIAVVGPYFHESLRTQVIVAGILAVVIGGAVGLDSWFRRNK